MNKLHSFTFYALITPVITLGAGAVLAQPPAGQDSDQQLKSTQRNQDAMQSSPMSKSGQSGKHRGFMNAAPANGSQASNLIGAEVKTSNNEDVGAVSDLIIDQKGQVVAVVVGVGGFLGMGEKDVAIGWDDVTRSGTSDDIQLKIKATRDGLMSAPEFKQAD